MQGATARPKVVKELNVGGGGILQRDHFPVCVFGRVRQVVAAKYAEGFGEHTVEVHLCKPTALAFGPLTGATCIT